VAPVRAGWRRWIAGGLFLVTGAGLVVHILVGLPLWLTVAGAFVLAIGTAAALGSGALGPAARSRVLAGLLSGAVATVAYDLSRLVSVTVTDSPVKPFEAWRLFGIALVGADAPVAAHWVVGALFHVVNGLTFAIAFTIWLGERGPLWGIGYALVLEAFMLALYPGWLSIQAYAEFTQVSVLVHVVYGSVLGLMARSLLRKARSRAEP